MNKKIKLPSSDIAIEYIQGSTLRELGIKYHVSYQVIYRLLLELGVDTSHRADEIDHDWLFEVYKKNSIRKTADILGLSESTVFRLLRKYKIKTRRVHPPRMIHKKILEEWEQTHNISQVSMNLDVSYNTVKKVLRANDKLSKGKGVKND